MEIFQHQAVRNFPFKAYFKLIIFLWYLGARSFHLEDIDDEEVHPPSASSETQALLFVEDQVPRYLTSSPCEYFFFYAYEQCDQTI